MMGRAPRGHSTALRNRPHTAQSRTALSLRIFKAFCEVGNVTNAVLQMRKLRFREVNWSWSSGR